MKKGIEEFYNDGHADGRASYANDIARQIHQIKIAIRVLDNFAISNDPRLIKEELLAASHVLEAVLKISEQSY